MLQIELEKKQIKFRDTETGVMVVLEVYSTSTKALQKVTEYLNNYKGKTNMSTQDFKSTKLDVEKF